MSVLTSTEIITTLRAAGCVFAEDEAALLIEAARDDAELAALVEQRVDGLPIEHVVGWAEFRGLRIEVDLGVFVPRRRTEFLVDQAIALSRPGSVVVDLCCGSGALGVAVASAQPGVELVATDIEPAAVQCARRNVIPVGGKVYEGDLFEPLPASLRGRVDILLSNVPYVPIDEVRLLPAEARLHEPLVTLDGGADGLDVLRRVSADAARWLAPGGSVLVETSEEQAPVAAAILENDGLTARISSSGELYATVVIGTKDTPEVRPATVEDLDGVVASSAALFAEDAATRDKLRNPGWPEAYGAQWCAALLADPQALVLVASLHGEVVGHLVGTFSEPSEMWTVSRAELVSMFVRDTQRGRGVGGRLVDAFAEWAKERGAARLHVTAYATNEDALRLYQSRGFAPLSITLTNDSA